MDLAIQARQSVLGCVNRTFVKRVPKCMSMVVRKSIRYSDEELQSFHRIITDRLNKSERELQSFLERIGERGGGNRAGGDWVDGTISARDLEFDCTMANRLQHYIRELENALIRIEQKTYGVCVVTGQLIDHRRLRAVPTTTKSITAKQVEKESQRDLKST